MKDYTRYRFFRNLTIFAVLAVAVLVPSFALAAGIAVVSVSTPGQAVSPGEQFTISINVEPNNDIAGMQFNLNFPPDMVTVDNVVEGNLLNQNGASTYFNAGQIDNMAGTVNGVFGAIITPGQTVATSGTFAVITMTAGSVGGSYPLTLSSVVIGDIQGEALPLSVIDGTISINRPPVLDVVGNRTVDEGQLLTFAVSATDPDADTLVYSASNLPSGASFSPVTKIFSWNPTHSQAGSYSNVRFSVSDSNLEDYENITILVNNVYQPDVNGDGEVNVLDIIDVTQRWEETGTNGWIIEDINENGTINILDVILIGQHWTD